MPINPFGSCCTLAIAAIFFSECGRASVVVVVVLRRSSPEP